MAEALLYCDALVGCGTHDKKRTHGKPVKPRNSCPVCWCVYLSDKLETSLYQDDMEAIFKFAGKKPTITYKETFEDDEDS